MIGAKQLPREVTPVLYKVIQDAEAQLLKLTGYNIALVMQVKQKQHLTPEEAQTMMLQNLICQYFNVTWSGVVSPSRKKELVHARHAYCYLAIIVLGYTAAAIGQTIGNRDHSTVLHSRDTIKDWIMINDPVAKIVLEIKQKLTDEIQA